MLRIFPTRADSRYALPAAAVADLIASIGTARYDSTCLEVLDESLAIDHWALFRYRDDSAIHCVASASRIHIAAAQSNVRQFIQRCHRVDPSLLALRNAPPEAACVAEMQAGDIVDSQYRHCFEQAGVKERLSFFVRLGGDLHQLSVFRGTRRGPLQPADIGTFSALAAIIVTGGAKHEQLRESFALTPSQLDVPSIERILRLPSLRLSRRESEVCARAATGMTIDQSAAELNIGRTSVITYRQRAYEKLNVSRQSELVALILRISPQAEPHTS